MHEVELIKRIRAKLGTASDIDLQANPNTRIPSEDTIRRVAMAMLELLDIKISPDGRVLTNREISEHRRATAINDAIDHGYTPTGFSADDHARANELRHGPEEPEAEIPTSDHG